MNTKLVDRETRVTQPARAVATLGPGLVVCAVAAGLATVVNRYVPAVSPLLLAIVAGAVAVNLVGLSARLRPGLDFAAKRLLRVGIALLGLQLVFGDILALGAGMLGVVVAIVVLGIAGTMALGKLLGIGWEQRFLIACGFSICGAAAVAAADGVVDTKEEEVLTAIALVVIFGTCMIPAIPLLSALLGLDAADAGRWAGGSIHEVAQVVAAGGAIGGSALAAAVVVKLARVVMLAPVMAVVSLRQRRIGKSTNDIHRPPLVPYFVLGFLACAALRSTVTIPDVILADARLAQTVLLTAAMFALGAGVDLAKIRRVGLRPFVLAAAATVWVATIAFVGVVLC